MTIAGRHWRDRLALSSDYSARQVLRRAANWATGAGSLCIIVAALTCCILSEYRVFRNASSHDVVVLALVLSVMFLVPAGVFLGFATAILQGRLWAVVTTLVIGILHGLLMGLFTFAGVMRPDPITAALYGVIFIVELIMIVNVLRCFGAIRMLQYGGPRGFAPILPGGEPVHQPPPPPIEWPEILDDEEPKP